MPLWARISPQRTCVDTEWTGWLDEHARHEFPRVTSPWNHGASCAQRKPSYNPFTVREVWGMKMRHPKQDASSLHWRRIWDKSKCSVKDIGYIARVQNIPNTFRSYSTRCLVGALQNLHEPMWILTNLLVRYLPMDLLTCLNIAYPVHLPLSVNFKGVEICFHAIGHNKQCDYLSTGVSNSC